MLKPWLVRIFALAAAFLVVDAVMETVEVSGGFLGAVGLALVYGLVSAVIGKVLRLLSFPLILLSAGLFELVINGFLLLVTEGLTGWIELERFWTAVGASIVLSVVSTVLGFALAVIFPETRRN